MHETAKFIAYAESLAVRHPPWDVRAEFFVLAPVTLQQGRLLVDENKEIESHKNCNAVFKNEDAAKKRP